jgi:hypothetical protein
MFSPSHVAVIARPARQHKAARPPGHRAFGTSGLSSPPARR